MRAIRELDYELKVDGHLKGSPAPGNSSMRRLADEENLLAVVYLTRRALMDRYIEVRHFIPLVTLETGEV